MSKVTLTNDQYSLVQQLSKELNMPENELAQFFVEMGISYVIAWRKGKVDNSLTVMTKKLEENPVLNKLAQKLEDFWNAG